MKRHLPDSIASSLDAEERKKLDGMTEVEREMYLYEKELNEQQERERASMLTKRAKEEEEEEAPEPRSKKSKRGSAKSRKSTKSTKSKSTKKSSRKRATYDEESSQDEEDEDYDEDEDYEIEREPSDMESEQESDDDYIGKEEVPSDVPSDEDVGRGESRSRRRVEEEYSQENDVKFEDMSKLQLRRGTILNWVNDSFLEETVKGFYVRVGCGLRSGKRVYVMARIDGIREDCAPYGIDGREMTDRMLILHNPNPSSKNPDTKISLVSNGDITQSEFDDYKRHASRAKEYICRASDVKEMTDRLNAAKAHVYTQEEVEERIRKNEKFHTGPRNIDKELSEALTTLKLLRKTKSDKDPDVVEIAKKIKSLQQMKAEADTHVTDNTRKLRELSSWNEDRRVKSAGPSAGAQVSFGDYSSNNKLFQRLPTLPLDRAQLERVKKELLDKEANKNKSEPTKEENKSTPADEPIDRKKSTEDFHAAISKAQEKKKERILQDVGEQLKRLHDFELDLNGPEENDESSKASSSSSDAAAVPSQNNTLFQSLTADDDAMLDSSTITFTQYMTLSNAA